MERNTNPSQINPIPKPTTSNRRLQANRANAQRSTGPRTPAGKAISRFNAIKHGILSSKLLCSDSGEVHNHKLEELRQELLNKFGADDIRVQLLVDNLILECWRQQRSLHTEMMYLRVANEQTQYWNTEFTINQPLMETLRRYATASQNMILKQMRMLDSYLKEARERVEEEDQEYASDDNPLNADPIAAKPPDEGLTLLTLIDAITMSADHPAMDWEEDPETSAPEPGEISVASDSEPAMTSTLSPNASAETEPQSAASGAEAVAGGPQMSTPVEEPAPPPSAGVHDDAQVLSVH